MTNTPQASEAPFWEVAGDWDGDAMTGGAGHSDDLAEIKDIKIADLHARVSKLEAALQSIACANTIISRHFSGPSPEDELDATVLHSSYEYLQELAACALMTSNYTPTQGEDAS